MADEVIKAQATLMTMRFFFIIKQGICPKLLKALFFVASAVRAFTFYENHHFQLDQCRKEDPPGACRRLHNVLPVQKARCVSVTDCKRLSSDYQEGTDEKLCRGVVHVHKIGSQ